MSETLKTFKVRSYHEHPAILLNRTWPGATVVATENPMTPMTVSHEGRVLIPLSEAPRDPETLQAEVALLLDVYKKPAVVYAVCCETPAGQAYEGLVVVPKAVSPEFDVV